MLTSCLPTIFAVGVQAEADRLEGAQVPIMVKSENCFVNAKSRASMPKLSHDFLLQQETPFYFKSNFFNGKSKSLKQWRHKLVTN